MSMAKTQYNFKRSLSYDNRILARILANVEKSRHLLTLTQISLPDNISPHVVGCVIEQSILIVYVESAAWATKLRFHGKSLLRKIKKFDLPIIDKIIVRITTAASKYKAQHRLPNRPANTSITAIQHSAQSTDGDLQKSLIKLSETLQSKQPNFPKIPDD